MNNTLIYYQIDGLPQNDKLFYESADQEQLQGLNKNLDQLSV